MLKILTPLVIIAGSLAYVAYRAQQAAIQAVPTAEHKKRWEANTAWRGTSWE
jgi:hypothetical protein